MRNEFLELEEARLLKVDRPKRRLRDEFAPYILIAKIAIVTAILLTGIHVVNQLDEVMSDQRMILKTQADCMDQIMDLRMEIDSMSQIWHEIAPESEELINLGQFTVTHYCPCKKCCGKTDGITATGTQATANRTIAVDPSVIPYGTEVVIDGIVYTAEDCGGAIKGNRIDIYVDSHEEAINRGRITREVRVK